jgi:hypothetical protein
MSQPKLPPAFVPENRLEELFVSFGKKGPDADAEFYREFLNSEVVTLGRPDSDSKIKEGYQRLESAAKFTMRLLAFKGEPVVAIYSSLKRMTEVIPEGYYRETGYLQLRCKTLFETPMSKGGNTKFALNPGHMLVKTFSPEEVKALLDGSIFKQIKDAWTAATGQNIPLPKGSQVWVGRPKVNPTGLMDKLASYFQSTGDAQQAWLGQILVQSSGQPPHLIICLKLSKDSRRTFQQVLNDLGPTIQSSLGEREILDILDADGEAKAWIDRLIQFFPK